MLKAKTVESERQSKLPLILAGVGWNGVEWVWRGYIFGYKMPIWTIEADVNDRVKVTHRDHGIMPRPPTSLFSFKCLSPRYLEALKEKTAGSLLRYQTCPKWVTFALAKSEVFGEEFFGAGRGEVLKQVVLEFGFVLVREVSSAVYLAKLVGDDAQHPVEFVLVGGFGHMPCSVAGGG